MVRLARLGVAELLVGTGVAAAASAWRGVAHSDAQMRHGLGVSAHWRRAARHGAFSTGMATGGSVRQVGAVSPVFLALTRPPLLPLLLISLVHSNGQQTHVL